ncbi:Protein of unknown function [Gryllus bimaculatus]|nr:Protein of unknown function [Gryllus bimaculatus]
MCALLVKCSGECGVYCVFISATYFTLRTEIFMVRARPCPRARRSQRSASVAATSFCLFYFFSFVADGQRSALGALILCAQRRYRVSGLRFETNWTICVGKFTSVNFLIKYITICKITFNSLTTTCICVKY